MVLKPMSTGSFTHSPMIPRCPFTVGRMVAYVDLEANPPVGKDQPLDLAALVPCDTSSINNVVEKTATLQIDGDVNSKPVAIAAKASKVSSGPQKDKPVHTANSSSSFADPEKFIEEILKKASAIVVAETMFKNTAYTEGFGAGIRCPTKRV